MKAINDEGLRPGHSYAKRPPVRREDCYRALEYVLRKIDENMAEFVTEFPAPASINLIYPRLGNTDWTSSFWTGMLWLAYEWTGKESYRNAAEHQLDSYETRLAERKYTDTHDLGFLYTLSGVASYKLTANPRGKRLALQAADLLIDRFFEKAGIIQAWGDLNNPEQQGRMIIDCCMNLPLLYWSSLETGQRKYYEIALSHANQAANHLVREDASTYHTFYMDVITGEPRFGKTGQGYSDDSCWSRGQAWGIYGFTLSYLYTGDWKFIELSKKLANYFLNRLPGDKICYWDLYFTDGSEERDSSAAAIAACGLLELAKYLPLTDDYRLYYENAALQMMKSLMDKYTTEGLPANGILRHAVYGKPQNKGVDECVIWGDYFYFEALLRLVKDWKLYW